MTSLIIEPTATAQWQSLVKEAWDITGEKADEEMEHYLVLLLMRFSDNSTVGARALGLEYLESQEKEGEGKQALLRDVGDKCLLISGLFPGRAERLRVNMGYYVKLGQGAYYLLSTLNKNLLSRLFGRLSEDFVSLMDVLSAARSMAMGGLGLTPLQAIEIWNETQSREAWRALARHTDSMPVTFTIPKKYRQ